MDLRVRVWGRTLGIIDKRTAPFLPQLNCDTVDKVPREHAGHQGEHLKYMFMY